MSVESTPSSRGHRRPGPRPSRRSRRRPKPRPGRRADPRTDRRTDRRADRRAGRRVSQQARRLVSDEAPGQPGILGRARVGGRIAAVLAVVLALICLPIAPAAADPEIPIPGPGPNIPLPDIPLPDLPGGGIPNPTDLCNNDDAPIPASPYGDGSFIVRHSGSLPGGSNMNVFIHGGHVVVDEKTMDKQADPFKDPNVSLESTYGTTPQWWSYDNGCTGKLVAGAGTSLANTGLAWSGALPNWVVAVFDAVINPGSWIGAMDAPVESATAAVTKGVWAPWLVVVLTLVAVLVLLRARSGEISGSVTATVWALLVLVAVSWLIQYPTESVKMVDSGVRGAVTAVATGFSDSDAAANRPATGMSESSGKAGQPAASDEALAAVDQQMDQIVRQTQYRTWLAGVFGSAESDTAKKYGPRLFKATHFTWAEYDIYRKDPGGDGKKILKIKQDEFKKIAAEIEKSDPVAYEHFRGEKWGGRLGLVVINGLVMLIVCGFLLMSAVAILVAFAVIRFIVPFGPAMGIMFMLESFREPALALLRRLAGPLVMGPIYFVVGLILLRIDGAILGAPANPVVKLLMVVGATWVAWKLVKPSSYTPGVPKTRKLLRNLVGAYLIGRTGGKAGADAVRPALQAPPQQGEEPVADPGSQRVTWSASQVFSDNLPAVRSDGAPTRGGSFAGGYRDYPNTSHAGQHASRTSYATGGSRRRRWWAPWADRTADRGTDRGYDAPEPGWASSDYQGDYQSGDPAGSQAPHGSTRPWWRRRPGDNEQAESYAGGRPATVHEAQVNYDASGEPVFVVYTPTGARHVGVDDDWWDDGNRNEGEQ
jgi:hypothetical protein